MALIRVATERGGGYTSYTLEEQIITYYTQEDNEWLYGTWKCHTPVGPVVLHIEEDGRMYSNMDQQLHSYSIDGDKLKTYGNGSAMRALPVVSRRHIIRRFRMRLSTRCVYFCLKSSGK